jgi:hypothetical protein
VSKETYFVTALSHVKIEMCVVDANDMCQKRPNTAVQET